MTTQSIVEEMYQRGEAEFVSFHGPLASTLREVADWLGEYSGAKDGHLNVWYFLDMSVQFDWEADDYVVTVYLAKPREASDNSAQKGDKT